MKYKAILVFLALVLLSGCAAREEPANMREPRHLITRDDYEDLQVKPPEKKPVVVDYDKEGVRKQNFDPMQTHRKKEL